MAVAWMLTRIVPRPLEWVYLRLKVGEYDRLETVNEPINETIGAVDFVTVRVHPIDRVSATSGRMNLGPKRRRRDVIGVHGGKSTNGNQAHNVGSGPRWLRRFEFDASTF